MEGNITLNIGDTLMVGRIAPTSIGFYDFEYTEAGYRKLDYYLINVNNQQIAAKQITELCKLRKNVIIEDFSEYGYIKFLKNTLKVDNLIFVERDLNLIKFTVEMSKWFFDKSYTKFFIIPTTLGNYCILNNAAENLLSIELDEVLPISRECIIPKSVNVVLLCEKGIFQPHYAAHKMEQKCHRNKIILSVDGESIPTFHAEPILLPKIELLPSKLTKNVESKIPIIGFCDNFSVLCCQKDDGNGYQFVDEWNGIYGTELVINFCAEKPLFGEKALSSSKETISYEFEQNEKLFTFENPMKPIFDNSKQKPFQHSNEIYSYEPGYLVYDIIKIMSMPASNIKIEDSWGFKITKDEDHPVLLEFMNDENELKLAPPEFLMAMFLRQHIKVIKKEIGEKPTKLGFCILDDDDYGIEEKERIKSGIKEACDLLKIDTKASYLQIHNLTGYDTTYQSSLTKLCYWFFDCTSALTSPITINLHPDDPFVRIDIDFGTNQTFFIDGFFYDNGTLTHWDGTIFSPNNAPCVYDIYSDDSGFVRNRTQCCTKFAPGKQVAINYPKCKKFRSRTIIHNPDFSIYATSSVNYTLAGKHVYMVGDWAGQDLFGFELANKFYQSSDPAKQFSLNATLPSTGDSKMFFTTLFVVNDSPIAVQDVIGFISDGNNTLMAEGIPYTKQNDCSYHSFPVLRVGVVLPTTVEMCCKEFEN